MSNTPETDAAIYPVNGVDIVWPEFARQLERERDEARKLAHTFRLLYYTQLGIDANTKQLPWEEVTK
jgi:hypothetical protein